MIPRLLLFDLDGTLLRSDKTISPRTLQALAGAKDRGFLIGICTSRSEENCRPFLAAIQPDIAVTCGGAYITFRGTCVHQASISPDKVREMICAFRTVCGEDTQITADTVTQHFWNYKSWPADADPSWGNTVWSDFHDFHAPALKLCAEVFDAEKAKVLADRFPDCDCIRFSDGYWYKFTHKTATKENALSVLEDKCGIPTAQIAAFGDDLVDLGMLHLCGLGVAMGNALPAVKEAADVVIGTNDEDGIARFLEQEYWKEP